MPKPKSPSNKPPQRDAPALGAFGPSMHNSWERNAQGVSLVRKAQAVRPLRFAAEPQAITLDIARTAVVVVDMQNDFCHSEGWFGQKGQSLRAARMPIAPIATLLPVWRQAGGRVVWLNWGIRPDALNLSPTAHFKGKGGRMDAVGYAQRSPVDRGRALVAGDWGAQVIDELQVDPADIQVAKHRLSGFWDNELDAVLRHQGITTLLFTGINTDRCVFSTLQDAAFIGYDCVLLSDACSTSSPAYVSRAIHFIVQQLHGFVATAAALQGSLAARRPQRTRRPPPSTPSQGASR